MVMANGTDPACLHLERKPPVAAEQEAGWVQIVAIRQIMSPTRMKLRFFGLVSSLFSKPTELPVSHRAGWCGISTYLAQILGKMLTALGCFSYSSWIIKWFVPHKRPSMLLSIHHTQNFPLVFKATEHIVGGGISSRCVRCAAHTLCKLIPNMRS
jgi:hypothetical protein